jgi:hypothetical protein
MKIDRAKVFHVRRELRSGSMGKPEVQIVCDCGRTDAIRLNGNLSTAAAAHKFRNRGWQVDPGGTKATCRRCKTMKKTGSDAPSPAARRALAQANRLLLEHFDVEAGLYAEGWSDAKVAETVKLSEDAVADWREDGFGPLAVPPEIARIEADIKKLREKVQTDLDGARELISGISRDFVEKLASLHLEMKNATKGMKAAA